MSKIAKALSLIEPRKTTPEGEKSADVEELLKSDAESAPTAHSESKEVVLISEPFERDLSELKARRIIHKGMDDFKVENAFRDLRTSIIQKSKGKNSVLLVTSVIPGGGASFVSINLAAAFTFDKSRTAVVLDCSLSRPGFYSALLDDDAIGITDFLENPSMPVEQIVQKTGVPRLRIIPTGRERESKAEYFTLDRTQRLFRDIKRRYKERYMIVDTPPISSSADTRALVELCDYVLMVVPYGRASDADIRNARRHVPDDKLMGFVLNDEPGLRKKRKNRAPGGG